MKVKLKKFNLLYNFNKNSSFQVDFYVSQLLRLLPAKVFHLGERSSIRDFQKESNSKDDHESSGHDGIPMLIRRITSRALRCAANQKTNHCNGCSAGSEVRKSKTVSVDLHL